MNILITRVVPEICITTLKEAGFNVISNQEDKQYSKAELIQQLQNCDGAVTSSFDTIDEEVISSCPKVKIFANIAVGYNNIDLAAAKKHNKMITNTPDVLSDSTAECAIALLFAVTRRICEADRYIREGNWTSLRSNLLLGVDVTGATIGLIGAGRIGRKVAEKLKGFDMNIVYHNRSRDLELEKTTNATYVSLNDLLSSADFISFHMPLTSETEKMIGLEQFKLMKKNAIIINTARGKVIDEEALIFALENKLIAGAGLDVFYDEPTIPSALLSMENVVLTPHFGSGTVATRNKMGTLSANNIISYLNTGVALTEVK